MKKSDLSIATDIYDCSKSLVVSGHAVNQKELGKFSQSLKKFERTLGENMEDSYWKTFLSPLKRYRFELCAAPLYFNNPPLHTLEGITLLKNSISRCKNLFPQFDELAHDILAQALSLLERNENPLLDFLSSNIQSNGRHDTAILLKESYLVPSTEEVLKSHHTLRKITLLAPVQLKSGKCYENLYIIGPAHWFPQYVFNAPRAPKVNVVRFGWIKDLFRLESAFINSRDTLSERQKLVGTVSVGDEEYLSSDELIPKIDWASISKKAKSYIADETGQEEISAKLFLLEGEKAVFLDAEENSSSLIIDLDEEDEKRVKRIAVIDISSNMYVLLRTSGGGDYIISVADKIMGKEAQMNRTLQKIWKAGLREAVRLTSLLEVSLKLIDLGSSKANEANVRNWMSYKSIRTWDYKDFAAIMKLVGLGDESKECWEMMGMIDTAHRKAGHHIRKLLLRKVLATDIDELQRLGKMDFELSEVDSGSLTAFRVRSVFSEIVKVAVSVLGHPFDVKDALWRG